MFNQQQSGKNTTIFQKYTMYRKVALIHHTTMTIPMNPLLIHMNLNGERAKEKERPMKNVYIYTYSLILLSSFS